MTKENTRGPCVVGETLRISLRQNPVWKRLNITIGRIILMLIAALILNESVSQSERLAA